MADKRTPRIDRGWIDVVVGLVLFAIGAVVFAATHRDIATSALTFLTTYVPMLAGALTAARGILRLMRTPLATSVPRKLELFGFGYKSFVAWRYLLVAERKVAPTTEWMMVGGLGAAIALTILRRLEVDFDGAGFDNPMWIAQVVLLVFVALVNIWGVLRHSKPALIMCCIGLVVLGLSLAVMKVLGPGKLPALRLEPTAADNAAQVANGTAIFGGVVVGLAMFFGTLRSRFTFFTTVPIGGVWIGTAALVMVLSVMSGFESDLRQKILGSNAHLQITRDDGAFVQWREVKAVIDRMPGVIASAPYATSEVVIAANNTGMNVIIKGIDPESVGKVTDLVSDLEDREAIKRLDPIITDAHDLRIPQHPRTETGDVVDPPPGDMPTSGEPIDFSGDAVPTVPPVPPMPPMSTDKPAAPAEESPPARPPVDEPPPASPLAEDLLPSPLDLPSARPTVDPPPPDLVISDETPADYSRPDYAPDSVVKVIDIPFDSPALSRRTQSLPGILVGRELVKQTHLYTGEEVRVVSPLSDPANPDATGTPIPFNRDYRVAGIFYTGMYEYDLKYVYVSLDSLQDFLDRGDAIDGIEVRVMNPDDSDAFISMFHAAFGPTYRVTDWKELNRSLFSALKLEKIAMFLVLGIVILVASFSIVGDLIMVVVEKQREIAALKTLGATDVGVMQLFAIQGLMIGVIGTVLGIATGLLGCWAGKRYGLPLNPDVYYIDRLPIHVEPASVVAAGLAGILISIAATLYPAVVAARVRPAEGMRH